MSLHADLLDQARFLACREPKKPIQVSLRRSVSASYYALFHLLVDEATRFMVSGSGRDSLRDGLARTFRHSEMKKIAVALQSNRALPAKLTPGLSHQQVQQPLIDVAAAFVQLQEARHNADYNRAFRFTRNNALDLADLAEQAFQNWKQVRGAPSAETFLIGLLVYGRLRG